MDCVKKLRCKICDVIVDDKTNFFVHKETHTCLINQSINAPGLFHTSSGLILPINKLSSAPDLYIPRILLTRTEDDLLDAEEIGHASQQMSLTLNEHDGTSRRRSQRQCRQSKYVEEDGDYEFVRSSDDCQDSDSDEAVYRRKKSRKRKIKAKGFQAPVITSIALQYIEQPNNDTSIPYVCISCSPTSYWSNIRSFGEHMIKRHKNSNGVNLCPYCPFTTRKTANFHRHLSTHEVSCTLKTMKRKENIKSNLNQYHYYVCYYCELDGKEKGSVKWMSRYSYSSHMKSHCVNGFYVCPKCPTFFNAELRRVNQHFKYKHESLGISKPAFIRSFWCRICKPERTFTDQYKLKQHMVKHKQQLNGLYHCPQSECQFTTPRITRLNEHVVRSHPNNVSHTQMSQLSFRCYLCIPFKIFQKADLYKSHLINHHQNSNGVYICPICDSKFDEINLISKHMETHKSHFPLYFCRACLPPTPWFNLSSYTSHVNSVHLQNGKIQCPICHNFFLGRLEAFKAHMSNYHYKSRSFGIQLPWAKIALQQSREKWRQSQNVTSEDVVVKIEGFSLKEEFRTTKIVTEGNIELLPSPSRSILNSLPTLFPPAIKTETEYGQEV